MPREVIGVKLTADTRQFVRGMHDAVRSFASVEYIAGRAASRFGPILSKGFQAIGFAAGGALIAGMGGAITSQRMNQYIFRPALEQAKLFNKQFYRTAFLAGFDPKSAQGKEFREYAIKAGLSSRFSSAEAMQGIGNLMTGGLSANEAKAFLPSLLNLSEASFGELDLPQAAKIMAIASKKFTFDGKAPEQVGKEIADTLVSVRQASRLEFGEILGMLDSMNNASSLLRTNMQETLGLATVQMRSGMSARRSGKWTGSMGDSLVNLRTVVDELEGLSNDGGKKVKAAAKLLNLDPNEVFYDKSGKLKNGIEILKELDKALVNINKNDQDLVLSHLLGRKEARSMFQTIREFEMLDESSGKLLKGFEALDYQIRVFNNAQGLAARGAEMNRKTLEGQLEILQGVKDTLFQLMGESYLEMTYPTVKALKGFLEVLTSIGQQNPHLVRVVSTLLLMTATAIALSTVLLTAFASASLLGIFIAGGLIKGTMEFGFAVFGIVLTVKKLEGAIRNFKAIGKSAFSSVNRSAEQLNKTLDKLYPNIRNAFTDKSKGGLGLKNKTILRGYTGDVKLSDELLSMWRDANSKTGVINKSGIFAQLADLLTVKQLTELLKAPMLAKLTEMFPIVSRVAGLLTGVLSNPLVLLAAAIVLIGAASVFVFMVTMIGVAILALTNLGLVLSVYVVKRLIDARDSVDGFLNKFDHLELAIKSVYNLLSGKGVLAEDKFILTKAGMWDGIEKTVMILYRFGEAISTFWNSLDWAPLEAALQPLFKAAGILDSESWARSSVDRWRLIGYTIAQVFNKMIWFAAITIKVLIWLYNKTVELAPGFLSVLKVLAHIASFVLGPFIGAFMMMFALGAYITYKVIDTFSVWAERISFVVDLLHGMIDALKMVVRLMDYAPSAVKAQWYQFWADRDRYRTHGVDTENNALAAYNVANVRAGFGAYQNSSQAKSIGLTDTIERGSVRPANGATLFSKNQSGAYVPVDSAKQDAFSKEYREQDAKQLARTVTNNNSFTINNPVIDDESKLDMLKKQMEQIIQDKLRDGRVFGF